jgi:hypothetical protein
LSLPNTSPELNPEPLATAEELAWLNTMANANGYFAPNPMGNGKWCALSDDYGYDDRWCFNGLHLAAQALSERRGRAA